MAKGAAPETASSSVLQPMPKRVTADWMAQQWRDGQTCTKKKIEAQPTPPCRSPRRRGDLQARLRRRHPERPQHQDRDGRSTRNSGRSVRRGYVASLKAAGKPSWKEAEKGLNKIADTLGRNRPAREVEPEEIVEIIRPIYERAGARAMKADHVRSYIHSAS